MSIDTVVNTLVAALTGGGGVALLNWWRLHRDSAIAAKKQEAADKLAANEQAFQVYKSMVDSLQGTVSKLTDELRKIEESYLIELRRVETENSLLRESVKVLEAKFELINGTVQPLIQKLTENQNDVNTKLDKILGVTENQNLVNMKLDKVLLFLEPKPQI